MNSNNKLQVLDISANFIEDEGAKHIGNALMHKNNNLINLNIESNDVTGMGMMLFTTSIGHPNCKLQTFLHGYYNYTGDIKTKIEKALEANKSRNNEEVA